MEELRSLADLLDLQEVDSQLDRLLHERQSLPELQEYKGAHELTEGIAAELTRAEEELRGTSLELDKTDGELEITVGRLEAEQNRLYAGGMSARDADYLRREVEMLDRKRSEAEDRVLELMEKREQGEATVAALKEEHERADATKAGIEAKIKEAWKVIDAQIAAKEKRKADIVPMIPEDLNELYEQLRDRKEGVAVGALVDDTCGGCHLKLTAAEQLEARKSDPARCIHCRRILVI